jgi:predicted phosphodiesterase
MTNILVISDIHANLEALQAVFQDAQARHQRPDQIWCLGDLVGYGPDPGACIDLLRSGPPGMPGVLIESIRGNHDEGVLQAARGTVTVQTSPQVIASWRWTAERLTAEQLRFLENLPTSRSFRDQPQPVRLVHAAPPDNIDQYLLAAKDVEAVIETFEEALCLFGHTHLACYFVCNAERREARPRLFPNSMNEPIIVQSDKLFINPGAVGQPRWGRLADWGQNDLRSGYPRNYIGVPEASYIWLELLPDTAHLWCHYVPYDYATTVRKLDGLVPALEVPERWKLRLTEGLR